MAIMSNEPKVEDQILGIGRTGLVVRQGQVAVKLPLRWSTSSDEELEANVESIQHEQAIYQRLESCDGVVPCLGYSETATQLRLMENGDLRSFLSQNKPSKSLQLSWFRSMAHSISQIHDRRIIVADIATRNFLLDADFKVKICDFTESLKMPLDTCMATVDWAGYSIHTDIGQLGAVMYEVVVGEKCEFDIFKDLPLELSNGTWPRREDLPSTEGLWLGPIIERCWMKGAFGSAHDLRKELDSVEIEDNPAKHLRLFRNLMSVLHSINSVQWLGVSPPATALAMTFGAIAGYVWSRRRD
ncbi:kinase-like domain-containing protein [Aspergillus granulosus]|uniref:non-specific serine/threonine protein kinase n=1 Tax=Aspergillus granulosus TaxID=176169 RepID=A0ABR4HXN4_9EURO